MDELNVKIVDQLENEDEKDSCHEDSKVERKKTMNQILSNNELNNVKHTVEFVNTTKLFPSADNIVNNNQEIANHELETKAINTATVSVNNSLEDHLVDASSREIT